MQGADDGAARQCGADPHGHGLAWRARDEWNASVRRDQNDNAPQQRRLRTRRHLLSAGQNNKGRQQGSNGAAGVAADLRTTGQTMLLRPKAMRAMREDSG